MDFKIHCKFDKMIDPSKLKNHPKNRNKHGQDQIERLAELYKYHGIRHPIIVSNLSKCIVAGHGRKLAAIRAGIKEMPVVYQDFDSSESEYAFIQADNAIALWAELDMAGINSDIGDLGPDFDINMLGIQDFTLDVAEKDFEGDPDEVPEVVEPVAKLGQIYKLGEHRLMCGDSTDEANVSTLMNGERADMVFTDPPYNLQEHGQTKRTNKTESKRQDFGDWDVGFDPLTVLPIIDQFTKEDSHRFVCTSNYLFGVIHDWFVKLGDKTNYIVWVKNNPMPSLSKSTFVQATELVVHSRKGKTEFKYPSGSNLPNVVTGNVEPHVSGHPSQKPIYFIEYFLSPTNGSVLDLFGGSGSTLIACEKTKRKCFMMELDCFYISVIIERWQKFTGKEAYLLNNDGTETPYNELKNG